MKSPNEFDEDRSDHRAVHHHHVLALLMLTAARIWGMSTFTPAQAAQNANRNADGSGQYAESRYADPGTDIGLEAGCARCEMPAGDDGLCDQHTKRWGDVTNIQEGSRTPWGSAQAVYQDVPGIVRVGTAGHGGIKLSPERNKVIPTALRNSSGWYEEDTESHIVAMYHPEAFPNYLGGDLEAIRETGIDGVKRWMPDEYEKATGETIPFGVSPARDEAAYNEAHRGEPCLYTTGAKEHPDYPGVVIVSTSVIGGHEGEWPEHMIPLRDYQNADSNRKHGAGRINPPLPKSAVDVTPPATTKKVPVANTFVDATKAANHYKADFELDKDWREQGTNRIFNLRGDIAAGKFAGKHMYFSDGWQYRLEHTAGSGFVTPVKREVFDAYQGPDSGQESDRIYSEWLAKSAAVERAQGSRDRVRLQKLEAETQTLREQHAAAKASEEAVDAPIRAKAAADKKAAEKARHDKAFTTIVNAARI